MIWTVFSCTYKHCFHSITTNWWKTTAKKTRTKKTILIIHEIGIWVDVFFFICLFSKKMWNFLRSFNHFFCMERKRTKNTYSTLTLYALSIVHHFIEYHLIWESNIWQLKSKVLQYERGLFQCMNHDQNLIWQYK